MTIMYAQDSDTLTSQSILPRAIISRIRYGTIKYLLAMYNILAPAILCRHIKSTLSEKVKHMS